MMFIKKSKACWCIMFIMSLGLQGQENQAPAVEDPAVIAEEPSATTNAPATDSPKVKVEIGSALDLRMANSFFSAPQNPSTLPGEKPSDITPSGFKLYVPDADVTFRTAFDSLGFIQATFSGIPIFNQASQAPANALPYTQYIQLKEFIFNVNMLGYADNDLPLDAIFYGGYTVQRPHNYIETLPGFDLQNVMFAQLGRGGSLGLDLAYENKERSESFGLIGVFNPDLLGVEAKEIRDLSSPNNGLDTTESTAPRGTYGPYSSPQWGTELYTTLFGDAFKLNLYYFTNNNNRYNPIGSADFALIGLEDGTDINKFQDPAQFAVGYGQTLGLTTSYLYTLNKTQSLTVGLGVENILARKKGAFTYFFNDGLTSPNSGYFVFEIPYDTANHLAVGASASYHHLLQEKGSISQQPISLSVNLGVQALDASAISYDKDGDGTDEKYYLYQDFGYVGDEKKLKDGSYVPVKVAIDTTFMYDFVGVSAGFIVNDLRKINPEFKTDFNQSVGWELGLVFPAQSVMFYTGYVTYAAGGDSSSQDPLNNFNESGSLNAKIRPPQENENFDKGAWFLRVVYPANK